MKSSGMLAGMLAVLFATMATLATSAQAGDRLSLSASAEVAPVVMSGIAGELGAVGGLGIGWDHLQLRVVFGSLAVPSALLGNDAYDRLRVHVGGVIVDWFFTGRLRGWWLGAGLESWRLRVRHEESQMSASWTSVAGTMTLGYSWRWPSGLFISPHAGFIYAFDPESLSIAGDDFDAPALQPELSVKLGWHF